MFKNIMLAAVCAFTVLSASAVQVKQYSKEAAVETFIMALAESDQDAVWQLVPRSTRNLLIDGGVEADAKRMFWNGVKRGFSSEQADMLKQLVMDKEQKDIVIAQMVNMLSKAMVFENGKWYIDFMKFGSLMTNPEQKAAAAPKAIDHSSKSSLLLTFYLAVLNDDIDTAWNAFSPSFRAVAAPNEAAVAQAKKEIMSEVQNAMPPEMRQQLKMILSGTHRDAAVNQMVMEMDKCFVRQDGKWYLDFSMMMQ